MPMSQGRAPEASQIVVAIEDTRMEMGGDRNGFHSWIASYSSRARLHMGNRG
jgi:hypothetical protein